jgi:RimJ/RimL family protein N-acetyltransferase
LEGGSMSRVAIRPYRPEDYGIVRRWLDDPIVTGGFPSPAPPHSDEEVRAIVRGEERPNLSRLAIEAGGRVVGEVQYRHSPPLLESIGFTAEGVLRRYFDGEGALGDLVMYAMTRDEWESR